MQGPLRKPGTTTSDNKMDLGSSPAFPLDDVCEKEILQGYGKAYTGLTKREYFAAMAMQGIIAASDTTGEFWVTGYDAAKNALVYADALIEELNK